MKNILALANFHRKGSDLSIERGLHTFLNPYSYLLAKKNTKLFSEFDTIFFDGISISKLASLLGVIQSERVSFDMTSLAPRVFADCSKNGKSIYFIGSTSESIVKAVEVFRFHFPDLLIVGYRHGYFHNDEDFATTQCQIRDMNPDVVIAGLGTPLQEKFLLDLRAIGWTGVGFTCGGFFHQTANRGIQYYPCWVNKLHLRWIYRIYDEPKLIKRYLLQYPYFFFVFMSDVLAYHRIRNLRPEIG